MRYTALIATALCAFAAVAAKTTTLDPKTERLRVSNRAYHREIRTDYETIPGKVIHWYNDGTATTNTPKRVDLVVQTNTIEQVLDSERKVANKMRKIEKDRAKAAEKDQKNLEKAVKELKKLQAKSSEEMYQLFQDAIDIFNGADIPASK